MSEFSTGLETRALALAVLDAALNDRAPAEARFAAEAAATRLEPRDRAFARLLYTTVLRNKAVLDAALLPLLRHPPPHKSGMNLLRLGAAQLLFLQTPPHAAVGQTVELAKKRRIAPPALVNAVLRRLVGRKPPEVDPLATLPDWLRASWSTAYGAETAAAIATVLGQEPPLDLSVKTDVAGWAARLGGEVVGPATVRLREAGAIERLPGYRAGAWWVQDLAASLPARLIGAKPGMAVLDLCAAPGGKTAQLVLAGAAVTAVEREPARAERLADNLERLGLRAEIVVEDALDYAPKAPFDAVLLDAPCSATGTIRRHPDILWGKTEADVTRLAGLQGRLLDAAARLVRPGGTLVHAVCSLEPEEGPAVVEAFLVRHPGFERRAITEAETGLAPTAAGDLRTHPALLAEKGGMDGFFIARFTKKS